MNHPIATYLENREAFYRTLLPRIPHHRLRDHLEAAVLPIGASAEFRDHLPNWDDALSNDSLLASLSLRDLLKKASFGESYGKTTISIEEALDRAQVVEQTGLLLFTRAAEICTGEIGGALHTEAARRESALNALTALNDALRYHRLKPED